MAELVGRATIVWNGTTLNSKDGASLDPGGVTRESQTSDQSVDHTSKLRPAMLKCEIQWEAGTSLTELNDISNATIQFETRLEKVYIIQRAFRTGELEAKAGSSGGISLTFEGPPATEAGGA